MRRWNLPGDPRGYKLLSHVIETLLNESITNILHLVTSECCRGKKRKTELWLSFVSITNTQISNLSHIKNHQRNEFVINVIFTSLLSQKSTFISIVVIISSSLPALSSCSTTSPNRPYSYSQYWTGTSLQWRLMRGNILKSYLHLKRFPRISLHCKLVPAQYWEYEYALFNQTVHKEAFQTILFHKTRKHLKQQSASEPNNDNRYYITVSRIPL